MKGKKIEIREVSAERIDSILGHVKPAIPEDEYLDLASVANSFAYLTSLLENERTTTKQLRKLLFGCKTERLKNVLDNSPGATHEAAAPAGGATPIVVGDATPGAVEGDKKSDAGTKQKGHGRNGADAYVGAESVYVPHDTLKPGDPCPAQGCKGKVYEMAEPKVLVRVVGRAPVGASVTKCQRLRCNLCLKIFTAQAPAGMDSEKYDVTAGSIIPLMRYGTGMPFNRLEGLQGNFGIPLPASTQWDIALKVATTVMPARQELVRQAAQADVLHNDDTPMTILKLMKKKRKGGEGDTPMPDGNTRETPQGAPERTGVFTSGIVSTKDGRKIALYFTGRKHAGENLADVLRERAAELDAPIQMCDALSRNLPKELEVILAHCLAHSRRRFVNVVEDFPDECRYVLETLGIVYKNDATAKEEKMSPEKRLRFHQKESGPLMAQLRAWMREQIDANKVEPNSGLGDAILYALKHWEKLTRFLEVAGAPVDNTIVERSLKRAIIHRKNSLFFKTERGAEVGDIFMSLIHTCELCGADAFDYLTELQRHADELTANPSEWMPWNYGDTVARLAAK